MRKPVVGLFITGTDTDVGKTYVAAAIARWLLAAGHRVGVYKPVASGCHAADGGLVSDDALRLWHAAGKPGELDRVCPQRFVAPLAPHLAAAAEGRAIDPLLLTSGLDYWAGRSDVLVVEGAGGFMSPLGDREYVADLAVALGLPLVVVAANRLGVINQVLQTLIVAVTLGDELPIAGVVLNDVGPATGDASLDSNRGELDQRAVPPVLGHLGFEASQFEPPVDWWTLAGPLRPREGSRA